MSSLFILSLLYNESTDLNISFIPLIGLIVIFLHLVVYQIKNLNIIDPNKCLKKFKSNNFLGLIVFLNM